MSATGTHSTLILVPALAALLLAGCGGGDAEEATSTSAAAAAAVAGTTTMAAAETTTTAAAETTTTAAAETTNTGATGDVMELTSDAFGHETTIPTKYSCDGDDVSPALTISGIPDGATTLALVLDDPDAPNGTWDHWVAYNISVVDEIVEDVGSLGTAGTNSWGTTGYGGPCPPSGSHRYFFTVYALDAELELDEGADKATLLAAIEGHVLAEATLMGTYAR